MLKGPDLDHRLTIWTDNGPTELVIKLALFKNGRMTLDKLV
jgi:hypothetical protein